VDNETERMGKESQVIDYEAIQKVAHRLWDAGFLPCLVENDEWFPFTIYPKISNGPIGGPRWPYILCEVDRHPPRFIKDQVRVGISAEDFEQEVTNDNAV
jgi:hypothetical protein